MVDAAPARPPPPSAAGSAPHARAPLLSDAAGSSAVEVAADREESPLRLTFGAFQYRVIVVCALGWASDNAWMACVANLGPRLRHIFGLPPEMLGVLPSAMFAGMMIGSVGWGLLSDARGRVPAFRGAMGLAALGGAVATTAVSYWMLVGGAFAAGLGVGGSLPVDGTLLAEFLPEERRAFWLTALSAAWGLGSMFSGAVAYFAIPALDGDGPTEPQVGWRVLLAAVTALTGLSFALRFAVPESPLWLAEQGRHAEADAMLRRIDAANGCSSRGRAARAPAGGGDAAPPPGVSTSPVLQRAIAGAGQLVSEIMQLFRRGAWRVTLPIWLVWALSNAGYTGFALFLPVMLDEDPNSDLKKVYLTSIYFAAASIPGSVVGAWLITTPLGRKWTLVLATLLTGGAVWLFRALSAEPWTTLAAVSINAFGQIMFAATFTVTPELFETASRGTGVGSSSMLGKASALASPLFLAPLFAAGDSNTLLLIVSACFAAAAFFAALLPRG